MKLAAPISVLAACAATAASLPASGLDTAVEAAALSEPDASVAGLTSVYEQMRSLINESELDFDGLLDMGTEILNEYNRHDGSSGRGTPGAVGAGHLRKRIDIGDENIGQDGEGGTAADELRLGALASETLAVLRKKVNENDLNDLMAKWLDSMTEENGSQGIATMVKRNMLIDVVKSLFSRDSAKNLAKAGGKALVKLARGIDYNSLANKLLDYLNSVMDNTDLNKI